MTPLSVWILNDGKIGDDVQCIAIAHALSTKVENRTISPRAFWASMAPWGPIDPADDPQKNSQSPLAGDAPDIIVASGRRAIPYGVAMKKNHGSRLVILKDPRMGRDLADFIWVPMHDHVEGDNVFATLTSPHALAAEISKARDGVDGAIAKSPAPILGVVLGGPSGGAQYSNHAADNLAGRINLAMKDFEALAVTPSRRTPPGFVTRLKSQIAGANRIFWSGAGDNPYVDILARASSLIVAGDSHNMVSEALSTGTGLYIWRPEGLAQKLDWFITQIEKSGHARRFSNDAEPFATLPIDATAQIVEEIRKRFANPTNDRS